MPDVRVSEESILADFLTDSESGVAITLTDEELAFVKTAQEMHWQAQAIISKAVSAAVADPHSTHSKEVAAVEKWRSEQPPREGKVFTLTRDMLLRDDLAEGLVGIVNRLRGASRR